MVSLKEKCKMRSLLMLGLSVSFFSTSNLLAGKASKITEEDKPEESARATAVTPEAQVVEKTVVKEESKKGSKGAKKHKSKKSKNSSDKKKNQQEISDSNNSKKSSDLQREHLWNNSRSQQAQSKIDFISNRQTVVDKMIDDCEKELSAKNKTLKNSREKKKNNIHSRRMMSRKRQKLINDWKKDDHSNVEQSVEDVTKNISAKINERSQLSSEISQLQRKIQSQNQDLSELKAESKQLKHMKHVAGKEIKNLKKSNIKIEGELKALNVSIKEAQLPYSPVDMF